MAFTVTSKPPWREPCQVAAAKRPLAAVHFQRSAKPVPVTVIIALSARRTST